MKRVTITILAMALAAASHAQAFTIGGSEERNTTVGAGTVVDQSFHGGFGIPGGNSGDVNGSFYYYGTYQNPRVNETASTDDGLILPFTTHSQPVEVDSITIVPTGVQINSGGLASVNKFSSADTLYATIYEVLPDDSIISTGETVTDGPNTVSGQGKNTFGNTTFTSYGTYILRPRTDYLFVIGVSCAMTFSDTSNEPSMGVTQEFNQTGQSMQGSFSFEALPEPPQYLALGLGMGGLLVLRRRRRA